MAVFLENVCKFGCDRLFPSLGDLIFHIEDTHIDYDPSVVQQKEASQPSCLPLSYVLRFYSESSKTINSDVRRKLASIVKPSSVRSGTPTGSEFDEEELCSNSEDSDDSWTTPEEFSSDFILKYGTKNTGTAGGQATSEKPFACPVRGCLKRYKNVNGIKYHSKNGHKKDGKIKKAYKCQCGKSYKTAQGLKAHSVANHFAPQPSSPLLLQTLKPTNMPTTKVLQSYMGAPAIKQPTADHKVIRAALENKLSREGCIQPKFETDLSHVDYRHRNALRANISSHGGLNVDISPNSTMGILTPASSPLSNASDKSMKLSKDDHYIPL